MPLAFPRKFPLFYVAGDVLNPRENLRLKDSVSLRRILPLRGGEGRVEGELSLFPTETEIAFKSGDCLKLTQRNPGRIGIYPAEV